ncbi:MAG: hypothetical protein ACE14P_08305 [Methanotrichaceae archaeon]
MQERKESMSSRSSGMGSQAGQENWSSDERMRSIKGQLQALDQDMKTATSQAAKDDIKQRRDELQRQLDNMQKK